MHAGAQSLLQNETVIFCVDTNILIEFKSLGSLPWREIAPAVSHVRVIVPTKVGSEMDRHKNSSGRLRKLARDFSTWAKRMETEDGAQFVLKSADPAVTIEFAPHYRTSELDADHFDLSDDDNRVVAEAFRLSSDNPDVILLADDSLPIRLARQVGLPWVRPPAEWRRQESPDEKDREISELKRQIGAQPNLTIFFPQGDETTRKHKFEKPPRDICKDCVELIVRSALTSTPKVPRNVLEKRYPTSVERAPFGMVLTPFGSVTAKDLDRYADQYLKYEEHLRRWARSLPDILSKKATFHPLRIDIRNDGDKAAENVHVEAELSGPFHFEPTDYFDKLLEDFLDVPRVPEPYFGAANIELNKIGLNLEWIYFILRMSRSSRVAPHRFLGDATRFVKAPPIRLCP